MEREPLSPELCALGFVTILLWNRKIFWISSGICCRCRTTENKNTFISLACILNISSYYSGQGCEGFVHRGEKRTARCLRACE